MQIISQEKILPWGLIVLRESDLNGYCPKGVLVTFWKRVGFEGGERETDLLVHVHCITSHFSLISSLFFSIFFLIFFFSFTLFSFYSVNPLSFGPLFRAQQGPFYSACRVQCFTTLPLNCLCLVWAYLPTTKGFVCVLLTLARQRQVCFICQSTVALLPATA